MRGEKRQPQATDEGISVTVQHTPAGFSPQPCVSSGVSLVGFCIDIKLDVIQKMFSPNEQTQNQSG